MSGSDMDRADTGDKEPFDLPPCAEQFIAAVTRKMRYRKRVRLEVREELTAHFEDELRDCEDAPEREQRAKQLIQEFGDPKLLAVLCRRAKKRCRPLWVRAFVRSLQAVGVFLLVFIPYTISFVQGRPNPTIDYLPQLNALHRPSGQIEDNAWVDHEKAIRLVVEPNETLRQVPWFKSLWSTEEQLPQQDRKVLEDWISSNSLAWFQLELAAARRQCHRVYQRFPGKPLLMDYTDDPPMVNMKWLCTLGLWKSRLALEQGGVNEALGYHVALLRAAAHWQRNAFLTEKLMGLAVSAVMCQEILHVLKTHDLSLYQLRELQNQMALSYADGYPLASFEGERLVMLDTVQHAFTHGGLGGGHYLIGAFTELEISDRPVGWQQKVIVMSLDVGRSMIHARRNRTIAKINEWYDRMNEIGKLSPCERREHRILCMSDSMGWVERLRYGWVRLLMPAERRVSELAFRARAGYEALMTVVAVKRYQLEKGNYPADLKILVQDGYLKKVPSDPYSVGALVYRPTDEDFILYSLGPNFADDGGEPGRDEEGRTKLWAANGDMVFWPVDP